VQLPLVGQNCGGRLSISGHLGGPVEDFPRASLVHLVEQEYQEFMGICLLPHLELID